MNEQKTEQPFPASAGMAGYVGFNYVNITGKGCEGWLNLFFDDECVAMVDEVELADKIRRVTPEKKYPQTKPCVDDGLEEFTPY